jgi:serralysin
VRVDLTDGTATRVGGTVSQIEYVTGSSGDDIVIGNTANNILLGGLGNDVLVGRDGAE